MTWLRRNILLLVSIAVLGYMLIPNLVVALFSFNNPVGRFNYTWTQFSTEAWANPCGAQGICESLGLSLQIGLIASLVATALGTAIAFALGRYRFRARSATNLLIFMPMATPEVVMGSSLLTLFLMMGVPAGRMAVTIAHIMFCISFVVVAVKARVATLDPRLEEAAADLGANAFQTFLRVTFAQLRRLHHHQLQREPELDHVPDVRLGCRSARCTGAGQRDRNAHVPHRAVRRRHRPGAAEPACPRPGLTVAPHDREVPRARPDGRSGRRR
jgi:ABC-type spermidine/putrescine transport system permease subunit II